MKSLLIGFALLVLVACVSATPKTDKKSLAIEVAKARVKVAEVDLEGATKEYELVKKKMEIVSRLHHSNAASREEHLEVLRLYAKASADMSRAEARIDEAKALLRYTETTGEVDLTLSMR